MGSITSALQRARQTVAERVPERPGRGDGLGVEQQGIVAAFVAAFERGDVPALVSLLAEDVRFTMPPLAAWFEGVSNVAAFLEHRSLVIPWRVARVFEVNGEPALLGLQERDGAWLPSALMVLSVNDGRIDWIASFLDPRDLFRAER